MTATQSQSTAHYPPRIHHPKRHRFNRAVLVGLCEADLIFEIAERADPACTRIRCGFNRSELATPSDQRVYGHIVAIHPLKTRQNGTTDDSSITHQTGSGFFLITFAATFLNSTTDLLAAFVDDTFLNSTIDLLAVVEAAVLAIVLALVLKRDSGTLTLEAIFLNRTIGWLAIFWVSSVETSLAIRGSFSYIHTCVHACIQVSCVANPANRPFLARMYM